MIKKLELLAKYFSDLSKILFTATVVKPLAENSLNILSLIIGIIATLMLIIVGYIIQPKE